MSADGLDSTTRGPNNLATRWRNAMAVERTMENGEVRRLVKWATTKRKSGSRKWKHRWVVIKRAPKR